MKTILALLLLTAAAAAVDIIQIRPTLETEAVSDQPDDPALWINRGDPSKSLIVATVKLAAPDGGLAVLDLNGKRLELVGNIDRPNNVDIQGDIVITTERLKRQLRVFRISPIRPHLTLIGTVPVFAGETGERGAPMGIGLFERAADKALFAIVSRKTGPASGYLWEYRIAIDNSQLSAQKVREFGAFSGTGEIEAVAVDDAHNLVYYSDEDCCVRVYQADPAEADSSVEIARFGQAGFRGNREGIAVAGDLVIVTDQLQDGSEYHVYRRSGLQEIEIWKGTAESTDGIEASLEPLGDLFPRGLLIAMNNSRRNFQLYSLR